MVIMKSISTLFKIIIYLRYKKILFFCSLYKFSFFIIVCEMTKSRRYSIMHVYKSKWEKIFCRTHVKKKERIVIKGPTCGTKFGAYLTKLFFFFLNIYISPNLALYMNVGGVHFAWDSYVPVGSPFWYLSQLFKV